MGILKNDIIDRERGMELHLARDEDILDDCSKESRGININSESTLKRPNHAKFYAFHFELFIHCQLIISQIRRICVCEHISFYDVLLFGI